LSAIPDKSEQAAPAQSQPAQPQSDDHSRFRRRCSAFHAVWLALVSVTLAVVPRSRLTTPLYIDWHIWLVALQVAGLAAFFINGGRSAPTREKLATALAHIVLCTIAALYALKLFQYSLVRFLELALRLTVGGLWLFAIAGLPLVAYTLWRSRRGQSRAFGLTKWWFSTAVLLLLAEPLAEVVDRRAQNISLPDQLASPEPSDLRIVAVGGSTMLGYPYEPKFGIPQLVGWRLKQLYPGRKIVVQNLAKPGANLRQAMRELGAVEVRPHLLLLHCGENEFYHELEELGRWSESPFNHFDKWLNRSPTFKSLNQQLSQKRFVRGLQTGDLRLADRPFVPPGTYTLRVARFRRQLEQLAEYCRRQHIQAVWFVPAGSEADFEPNRSVMPAAATEADCTRLEQLYAIARQLEFDQEWSRAADAYRRGLGEWPGFAEFHFRLAECLVQLGQYDAARNHFSEALEHDGHPVRAGIAFRQLVAAVAREQAIPLVDAAAVLRPHTPFGILDRSVFLDEVHPKLHAAFLLAMAAVDRIDEASPFGPPDIHASNAPVPKLADAMADLELNDQDLATAYLRIGNHFKWLGIMRFEQERRERQAAQYLNWSRQLKNGEIQPGDEGTEPIR
jgi:tetratricopeptide (TPR) repeat protein